MKQFITVALVLITSCLLAQESSYSTFRKYAVESTGCFVYLPATPGGWKIEQSEDGSDVYTNSVEAEGLIFDIIVVQFGEPLTGAGAEDLETLLISYLDYLKGAFIIKESVGYGKGQQLPGNEAVVGVLDFWKDSEGNPCKIKGWINETHLAVMMVTGTTDPSENGITDVFLNGFRFPEKH
jgi:hypothetical protein